MVDKKKEEDEKTINKVREISLDSLKKQRDSAINIVDGYDKLREQFGFDLFPFVVQANKNLVETLKLQIEIIEENEKRK